MGTNSTLTDVFGIDIFVGHRKHTRLQKHRNEYGEYVLSTPGTQYEIQPYIQTGNLQDATQQAVIEVFVDDRSALCPPSRTRLLRSNLRVRGFEKGRVDLSNDDDTIERSFEFEPFEFANPRTDQDRNHPELGLIRVEFYEPILREVGPGRRRCLAGNSEEATVQPRQGKKANGPERMTTKGGDAQLSRPFPLRPATDVHTIYVKGQHIHTAYLRYYNDPTLREGVGSFGYSVGSSSSFRPIFHGTGNRLGGEVSRDDALARLTGRIQGEGVDSQVGNHAVAAITQPSSENFSQQDVRTTVQIDEEEEALRAAIQLSLESSGMLDSCLSHQVSDDANMQQAIDLAIALSLQENVISGVVPDEDVSASSSTESSRGHEQCFACSALTKQISVCRVCDNVRWHVCQECCERGRNTCCRCSGRDVEVRTDSDLRSNEIIDSSLRSSHDPPVGADQRTSGSPAHYFLGENDQTWDIEEEYSHPSWVCEDLPAERCDNSVNAVPLNVASSSHDLNPDTEISAHSGNEMFASPSNADINTGCFENVNGTSAMSSLQAPLGILDAVVESELEHSQVHDVPNLDIAAVPDDGGRIGTWMLVVANWDSSEFGEEYLSLQLGEWLRVLPGIVQGWSFAFSPRLSSYGWYPPTYAELQAECSNESS